MTAVTDDSIRGKETPMTIAFGPVPSRRLGRSLGINNIPHKICTYSCVYCQVGRTLKFRFEPSEFYEPEVIAREVGEKIDKAQGLNEAIDYLTFVPDGEPTLDLNIGRLKPATAYISIPTRPPAESWVLRPTEEAVARAHQILGREVDRVEYLIGYEGNAFAFTGNPEEDLLSITAVHPMREDAVREFLQKARADWSVVRGLLEQELIVDTEYEGKTFFIRKFPKRKVHT